MATSYIRLLLTLLVIIWSLTATVETLTLRELTQFQLTAWSTLCGAAGIRAAFGLGAALLRASIRYFYTPLSFPLH